MSNSAQSFQSARATHLVAIFAIWMSTLAAAGVVGISIFVAPLAVFEARLHPAWYLLPVFLACAASAFAILAIVRRVRGRTLAAAALVPACLLAFLCWDVGPRAHADLGPRLNETDAFYRCVLWLAKGSPNSRLQELAKPLYLPKGPTAWPTFAQTHREEILEAWRTQPLAREWVDTLRTTPNPGTWPQTMGAPSLDFRAVLQVTELHCALAMSQSADGKTDDALATLAGLSIAVHKLQESGPTIVNQMIFVVVERRILKCARSVLAKDTGSKEARGLLRASLEAAPSNARILRQAIEGEVEFLLSALARVGSTSKSTELDEVASSRVIEFGIRHFKVCFFHENRTGRYVAAELRNLEKWCAQPAEKSASQFAPNPVTGLEQLRNPAGRIFAAMAFPAFDKSNRALRDLRDDRASLIEELSRS